LRLESSHFVKNVTRVESSHHLSQRNSSRVKVTKNRDSSRVIDSSHTITAIQKNVWWRRLSIVSGAKKNAIFCYSWRRFRIQQQSQHKYPEDIGVH